MNFINSVKYRYSSSLKLAGVIYAAAVLLLGIMVWANAIYHNKDFCEAGIPFLAMMIIAFVCGVLSFDSGFDFLMQNSVSRDGIHFSFIATLPICAFLAASERLISFIASKVLKAKLLSFLCGFVNCDRNDLGISILSEIVLETLFLMAVMCLGYFLITFFKRVKVTYIILTALVLASGIAIETLLYTSAKMVYPVYFITLNAFFVGATAGEIIINHLFFALAAVIGVLLSLTHIMTLTLNVNTRRKIK